MRGRSINRVTRRDLLAWAATLPLLSACDDAPPGPAQRSEFTIGWSIYAGWTPWEYAERSGIVKKWADRFGLRIEFVQIGDYVESLDQFRNGEIDGVTATLGDGFAMAAAGGRDTTAVLVNDYSNGNDGILSKTVASIAGLRGRRVHLQQGSVSHYLLARALDLHGLDQRAVTLVNLSNAEMVAAYNTPDVETVVTWNPELEILRSSFGGNLLFDSSRIPGEILDALIVDTGVLRANPALGRALTGIWFETLPQLFRSDGTGEAARTMIAALSGVSPGMQARMFDQTAFYHTPQAMLEAMVSPAAVASLDYRVRFRVRHGLAGGIGSLDQIGIAVGDRILGNPRAVRYRIDPQWVRLAAAGQL